MACCGLSGKSVQSLAGLTMVLGLTVVIGGPAAAVGLGLAGLGPRGRTWARLAGQVWLIAVARLARDVAENARLLARRWRCRWSGRLFALSPRMSGAVYQHFLAAAALAVLAGIGAAALALRCCACLFRFCGRCAWCR